MANTGRFMLEFNIGDILFENKYTVMGNSISEYYNGYVIHIEVKDNVWTLKLESQLSYD